MMCEVSNVSEAIKEPRRGFIIVIIPYWMFDY